MSDLKDQLTADVKAALKARDKARVATLRLALSEVKQREVDSREDLDDTAVLAIIDKMIKQRRDSAEAYEKGDRVDLAAAELAEVAILKDYLPQPLSEGEIEAMIASAISETGAASMQQMGAVMALIKPQAQGRADMGKISQRVRAQLSA
ncbi:MAG: GatB/YqeY domain-containing protein [Pseudomonadota bacterium]